MDYVNSSYEKKKFCTNCGNSLLIHTEVCPVCRTNQPKIMETSQVIVNHQEIPKLAMLKRPFGVTIISVLIGIGFLSNIINITGSFGISPIIGTIDTTLMILQIVLVYGLWNLKKWGANLGMGIYLVNIIYRSILTLFLADFLAEWAWQQFGSSLSPDLKTAYISAFKTAFYTQFFIGLFIGIIIISYLYSKRNLFVK
ncbi:MAG: hypothetical protein ACFFAE_16515 [Candidatus Hodarchaeota archaeon]